MGLRLYLDRLPEARLDRLRRSLDAWHELERDQERMWEAEDEALGYVPDRGGTALLGHASLDKAWDALHFLLDPARRRSRHGDRNDEVTTPGGAAVWGWHPMPSFYEEEFRYLPRYSTAVEVVEIATALQDLDLDAALAEHGAALGESDVYTPLGRPPTEGAVEFLRSRFETTRAFYREASNHGQAVFLYLT